MEKEKEAMLLSECYEAFGGSYEAVKQRISNDATIQKFLLMFLKEPSYGNLCEALEKENYENAFRVAHSLKGISQNLSFQKLEISSSALTELLRNYAEQPIDKAQCKELFDKITVDYKAVWNAVDEFARQQ